MIKPKVEWKAPDAVFLFVSKTVHDRMTTNAAEFPDSTADVTALATENTAFETSLQNVENGKLAQKALVDIKDANRETVLARLRKLIGQVNAAANGDINIIHDAGMQGTNEPTPLSLAQVTGLQVTQGANQGELLASWNPVMGRAVYQVQISTDAGAPVNWIDKALPTASKCSLNHDLVSATKVWVRVRATAGDVVGAWSDAIQKTVP